jgi:MoaA/NifB/PqqE/SkfB family radical SAM enzyme/SAM-dependent methyltransferase
VSPAGGLIISKTACVVPWTNLILRPDGTAHFCCDVTSLLTVNGRQGNLSRDSLDDLWNADELVRVRFALARGEKPASCSTCWKQEARGAVSRRLLINSTYRSVGGDLAVEHLWQEGAATGYRLERRPDWFILELGNVCNVKCRSCNPISSSRIAADPVQVAWTCPPPALGANGTAWYKRIDKLAEMIAGAGHETTMLSIIGGEPFLIPATWQLLDELVARGIAPSMHVGLTTNGQQRNARLADLAPHFRNFNVSVSIDGYGKLNDYLRYGSVWANIVETLDWLQTVPNVTVAIAPTLQNVNALDLPALLRFVDARDLLLSYNALNDPARLRPANLPPLVRRVAARRLRRYVETECKPVNRSTVRAYCELLEEPGDAFDPELFHEFAAFTNDLDADRGENLRDTAPELFALIRVAGVEWPQDRRHVAAAAAPRSSFDPVDVLQRMNRTVSSHDAIFDISETVAPNWYFRWGAEQLAEIDARLREHGHAGLVGSRAVADFASHYGRMTRALRAALPHAAVYACDIDAGAVDFCAGELGALPVLTGWRPDEERLPAGLDAIVCISLLTHTPLEHWRRTLRAWLQMLRPGGVVAFTYLSEARAAAWRAGEMEHYGSYPPELRAAAADALREDGFAFAALAGAYGAEASYGVTFATAEVVQREIAAAGLDVVAMPGDANALFGQELALARRPSEQTAVVPERPAVQRDVCVIALYDPRCYAPTRPGEGDHAESTWVRLMADPSAPLPTELGFGDPRVPELRETQAVLAREHAVDAFCYAYAWGAGGPRWDAPFRDLLASGRPSFPFCIMIVAEDGTLIDLEAASAIFDDIADALRDRRYVRVEGKPLIVVRDLASLAHARVVAATWRSAAAERDLGELHLCARQPRDAVTPHDVGFDSFVETWDPAGDVTAATAASLTAQWPAYRLFRSVPCRRNAADPREGDLYELQLSSAVDATRRRGEKLVFIDAWNDWVRGRYLEPDDYDGRAALLATRRAARGPASGLVLMRRLRDALGEVEPSASAVLDELEHVVSLHENARDRLFSAVEVALGTDRQPADMPPRAVRSRLPSLDRHAYLDRVAGIEGAALASGPIVLRGGELRVTGWAHVGDYPPSAVEIYLALDAFDGGDDRLFRVDTRVARPDVVAAFPDYPPNCGFEAVADIGGLAPGMYRLAIVQRTPDARYRDATAVLLVREEASCSTD